MLKDFLKDSVIYGVAAVASRALLILLVPLMTRVLSPAEYGAVDILTIVTNLAVLTVALEISQAVPRFFVDATSDVERSSYASTGLWFTVGTYVAFGAAAAVTAAPLSKWLLGNAGNATLLRVALLAFATGGLFLFAQNQLRWQRQPVHFAIASVVAVVLSLLAISWFLVGLKLGTIGVFLGQSIGSSIGALVALYYARRSYRLTFDARKCREMLRFSAPLVPSGVAVFVALYSDRIIVQRLLSLEAVGQLAVGYRFASIVGLAMVGFQGALTPLVLARYREPDTPQHLARVFAVFWALALLLCTGLAAFARELVALVTTPRYSPAAAVIPLLAPAIILAGMYIFAPGLVIAKRTGYLALVNVGGALLNVTLNLLWVPPLGIRGAALATLVSAAVTFAAYMIASQRLYPAPHHWPRLLTATVVAAAAALAGYAVRLPVAPALGAKLLLVSLVAAVAIAAGLIQKSDIARSLALVRTSVSWRRAAPPAAPAD
jgi:O-antigen/teichoic acid export membrane protein